LNQQLLIFFNIPVCIRNLRDLSFPEFKFLQVNFLFKKGPGDPFKKVCIVRYIEFMFVGSVMGIQKTLFVEDLSQLRGNDVTGIDDIDPVVEKVLDLFPDNGVMSAAKDQGMDC
jgi:hypothetical protein